MKDDFKIIQKSLIKLYLTVKVRKQEDSENITPEILQEEEQKLKNLNLSTLIEYIQSSIDILVQLRVEEQLEHEREQNQEHEDNEYWAEEYETLLKKEEKEIRQHISIEQQLKIHAEKLTDYIEELENQIKSYDNKIEKYEKVKDNEQQLNEEINNMKQVLKSYEAQNFELVKSEKRLKIQLLQKDDTIKQLEKRGSHRSSTSVNNTNKNGHNHNTSICSNHSRSKSRCSEDNNDLKRERHNSFLKKSPIPVVKMKLQDQMNEYHKLVNQRIKDLSKVKKDHKTSRDKSSFSNTSSFLSKDKSIDNDLSIISKHNDDFTQRLHDVTLKVLKGEEKRAKTPIKKIPINKKNVIYTKKKDNKIIVNKLLKKSPSDIPIVINQSDMPCFNNINIFTNNENNNNNYNNSNNHHSLSNNNEQNQTTGQVNLRQFIFSKCNSTGNRQCSRRKREIID